MGRKYGSIHISIDNKISIECLSTRYAEIMHYKGNNDFVSIANSFGLSIKPESIIHINKILEMNAYGETFEIKVHNDFLSIIDKKLTFENIKNVSENLSAALNEFVVFASVYDDDIYVFGLCESGITTSMHISGECEAYGIDSANENIDILEQYLNQKTGIVVHLNNLQGKEIEEKLRNEFGLLLP